MENYEVTKSSALATAGFIVSLVSILLGGSLWIISLPLSIAGTVVGSRRGRSGKGFGIAGIIISVVCIIEFAIVIVIVGALGTYTKDYVKLAQSSHATSKSFGTYELSKDWVEAKSNGSKDFFYCSRERRNDDRPNNIEVRCDKYDYSEDEVLEFKESLQRQMYMQAPKGSTVTGSGFKTDKGYDAFVYNFDGGEGGQYCSQYYIMGDKRFVMISAMIWNEEEDETDQTIKCAETIVNSFEWK